MPHTTADGAPFHPCIQVRAQLDAALAVRGLHVSPLHVDASEVRQREVEARRRQSEARHAARYEEKQARPPWEAAAMAAVREGV